ITSSLYSVGDGNHDREIDARTDRRERPRESPEVLHRGARVREAGGLPEPWQPPMAHRRTQGDGRRADPLRRQIQAGSSRAARSGERGQSLRFQDERLPQGLRDLQGARTEVQGPRARRGELRHRGLLHRPGRQPPHAAPAGARAGPEPAEGMVLARDEEIPEGLQRGVSREGRCRPARVPKPSRQDAHPGIRGPLLQRPSPPPGLHVRAPALRHRGQGWQPAERGPRPVQFNPAQPGQAASRQAPRVAEFGRCGNQAPPGEVRAEAQRGRRGPAERRRLRAPLQSIFRGAREEVRVRTIVTTSVFLAISDPTRRAVLDLLATGRRKAGDIAASSGHIPQPAVSRHLKVLREAGLVSVEVNAQQRIYELKPEGLGELYEWVAKYQAMWPDTLEALERYLDARAVRQKPKGKKR